MKITSVIICAYNEEKTIRDVVLAVAESLVVGEIIVVNDGSTDNTKKIIEELKCELGITTIHLTKNKGKGYAMAVGVENAAYEIIVFIDADLSNLQQEHFAQLVSPVLNKEADMVLGQATETLINYSINPFKSFTGERALYRKDVLPLVDKMKDSRFGVETLINLFYQSQGKTVKYVMLKKLKHPTKFDKTSKIQAVKEFINEGNQIAVTAFKNFHLLTGSIKKQLNIS
jgi:glycosyltransferase involved in cell wall biosynthesis